MEVSIAAASLRACREFAPVGIDPGLVEQWVDRARWCGSSKNSQPWRFVAVRDRDLLCRLSTLGDFADHLAECSLAIAVASVPSEFPFSTTFDIGRVVQTLMLLAHEDGVGSCVAVFEPRANVDLVGHLLGAPAGYSVDVAVSFGYRRAAASTTMESPSRRGRLDRTELLYWEHFPAPAGTG